MARTNELYEKIAAGIVAQMEDGVLPWHRPWAVNPNARVSKPLRQNAVPYQGINVLILWGAAIDAGHASPFWMTYRQAQSIGAQVRRGERATHIVFAKTAKKRERDETSGEEVEAVIPVRRVYAVFNADQIDGLPEKYVPEVPDVNPDERDAACQAWIDSLGIEIRYGGERAYYAPGPDRIQMPPFETFESSQTFFSTVLHEATHATGHRNRLDRLRGRLDEKARAREELVAELGSAFLCADLRIASSPRADHASYIASWLELLTDEPRAVFDAATQAQQAVEFLHALHDANANPSGAQAA
ncbi:MAG: zincin-like metallopeptidase domain-containing protein [Gammaproteobacteria bacterium]|nr:zincin-like metallopeptidase domain-containing protein [Gammaproteobacteria bacterium]